MFTLRFHLNSGKSPIEEIIRTEIDYWYEALDGKLGQPMDIGPQLTQTISNMATHIVFGSRVDYSSDQLDNLQFTDYLSKWRIMISIPFVTVSIDSGQGTKLVRAWSCNLWISSSSPTAGGFVFLVQALSKPLPLISSVASGIAL